ncbi:NAD(P)-dependent oxidoreductase [Ferruginibacter yonginensis]|uniref:NAD(P)-dependent oxidoreductase n=1 Tax=Ferruginibacter yonginensis TaxID=1310416 RepID=A0ABV8QQH6_9BACT
MITIGLIREGKIPADARVALTPAQCKWIRTHHPHITVKVQQSATRCFKDAEYVAAGVTVTEDMHDCDILLGIKEVPIDLLIPNKTYLFFSHTKKLQPYNQKLLQAIIEKNITLIDYECLEHEDGARIIGFGFFAGIVGAHNGMMAYGNRTGAFKLVRVNSNNSFQHLMHTYFGLKIPPIKIAVTGSGRVAHGVLEIMNLLGIHEVEPEDYLAKKYVYPVYVHLKGSDLYEHKVTGKYSRSDFHDHPEQYNCTFKQYTAVTDILMNGIYWEQKIDRLFDLEAIQSPQFNIQTIADITDDMGGSVPCNLGDSTIAEPVYGVDKNTFEKTLPYLPTSVDVMAVGNLPNELPKDASRYFGEQLIKHVFTDLFSDKPSRLIHHATIVKAGKLNDGYAYMQAYAEGK